MSYHNVTRNLILPETLNSLNKTANNVIVGGSIQNSTNSYSFDDLFIWLKGNIFYIFIYGLGLLFLYYMYKTYKCHQEHKLKILLENAKQNLKHPTMHKILYTPNDDINKQIRDNNLATFRPAYRLYNFEGEYTKAHNNDLFYDF